MPKQPMKDLIVLLPGIMGSVLQKNGVDVWAISGQAIWHALTNMNDTLKSLELTIPDPKPSELEGLIRGDPHALDDLNDGIRATRLMADVHMIPGLWKIDGYSGTKQALLEHFKLIEGTLDNPTPTNLLEFPYDWRRDNRIAAYRLKQALDTKLKAWRDHSGAQDAKVILIAHSMGGLVSRYYLEVLEGWRDCKLLVSFGTPYSGSLNAVNYLVNGFKQLFFDFTNVVRSCTGVYQLLPNYPVINAINGLNATQHRVDQIALPNLDRARASSALEFHAEINAAVKRHRDDPAYRDGLHIEPIVGSHQPTLQSATLENGVLTATQTIITPEFQTLTDGDSTVPQISAIPPEQFNDLNATFFAEKHGSIQANNNVLEHILKLLEMTQLPKFEIDRSRGLLPRRGAISLLLDDLYAPQEPVIIRARVTGSQAARLEIRLQRVGGKRGRTIVLQGEQDDWQQATLENLKPGLYRVQVRTVNDNLDPVHDIFAVAG